MTLLWEWEPPIVLLVRRLMDYIEEFGCGGPEAHELDEGCDFCQFDQLLQALPYSLRRDAIRATPEALAISAGDCK